MADSNIDIGGLTATGGAGQIILLWSVIEANCLPYLRLDKVEVWESATNDRSAATKIYEIFGTQIARGGLARNTTRYYWVRPRDISGNVGEFYPLSPTNGVSAATNSEIPPAGSVGNDQLQDGAVTGPKIEDRAVGSIQIALQAIISELIADLAINDAKLADSAVTTRAIVDEAIAAGKLAAAAVTEAKIAADAVTAAKIAAGSVLAEKIAAGAVVTDKLDALAVTAAKIAVGAVLADKIGAGAVTTAKLDALAVTAAKLAAGAVTADKISVTDLSAITANLGTVTAGTINGLTINGGTITGAVIRTATSGNRVELSGSQVMWTPSGVTPIMYIRAIDGVTPFNITWSLPSEPLMMVRNNSTGPSARFYGNGTTPAVVEITQDGGTSSGNVALYARNLRTGGGRGYAGLPNGDGGFAFYSGSGGYGPFTGQHEAFLLKAEIVDDGDIVVDWRVVIRKGIDDTVTEVRVSDTRGQKAVVGIVSRRVTLDPEEAVKMKMAALPTRDHEDLPTFIEKWLRRNFDLLIINSLGEGQVNVCGRNGNIERGDLLMSSSMRGKAERQDDDIQRSITVAKAREDVIFDHPDQVRRVACIYLCG